MLRLHPAGTLKAAAAHVGREADVVAADGLDLAGYLVGKPHVVLVGNGHEVGRGTHDGRLEVEVVAKVAPVDIEADEGVTGGIFPDNGHGAVGRTVVLHNEPVYRIGLPDD